MEKYNYKILSCFLQFHIEGKKIMPNEMKYGSVIYKVYTVFRNVLFFKKCYTGGQMWKKILEML